MSYPSWSFAASQQTWLPGFVDGIGQVPGGPRSDSQAIWSSRNSVQLRSGSVAVIPESSIIPSSSSPHSPIPYIKPEPLEDGEISEVQSHIEQSISQPNPLIPLQGVEPQDSKIKDEDTEDLRNNMRWLFENARTQRTNATRSLRSGASIRQDVDGKNTRSRLQSLSECPFMHNSGARHAARSRTPNPMFFPVENRLSTTSRSRSRSPVRQVSTTRSSLSSLATTSSPDPPDSHVAEEQEAESCQCPVSLTCPHRAKVRKLDCRPLVREYEDWKYRRDQEAFDQ